MNEENILLFDLYAPAAIEEGTLKLSEVDGTNWEMCETTGSVVNH